jgi:hypothetical protein
MYTYTVKQGDVARFPNGVEVNYDAVTESLVILHPAKRVLTIRPDETPVEQGMVLSRGVWLLHAES